MGFKKSLTIFLFIFARWCVLHYEQQNLSKIDQRQTILIAQTPDMLPNPSLKERLFSL